MDKLKLLGTLLTVLLLSISTNAVANGFKLTELKEFNEHKEECFLALNNGHSVPITFSGTHKVDDENLEKVILGAFKKVFPERFCEENENE